LKDLNDCSFSVYASLPLGYPVMMIPRGLKNSENLKLGGYPFFIIADENESTSEILNYFFGENYSAVQKKQMDLYTVMLANDGYQTIDERRISCDNETFCVYIPRFWPKNWRIKTPNLEKYLEATND
jgi:hypothetical protein